MNLTYNTDIKWVYAIVEEVIYEFPELHELYDRILIILALKQHYANNTIATTVAEFLNTTEPIIYGNITAPAHNINAERKGCLEIILDIFQQHPGWMQRFICRHECCHLLHPTQESPTLELLLDKYQRDFVYTWARHREEYNAHLCMVQRHLSDWLRVRGGIPEDKGSPRKYYRSLKHREGVKKAILNGISNSILFLRMIYLYEQIIAINKLSQEDRIRCSRDLGRFKRYLRSFWRCIRKDTKQHLPSPYDWLTETDFKNLEAFLINISEMLNTLNV
jgi:hypothetical protein